MSFESTFRKLAKQAEKRARERAAVRRFLDLVEEGRPVEKRRWLTGRRLDRKNVAGLWKKRYGG